MPLFFDNMTDNASKTYLLSKTRFNVKQKALNESNTQTCVEQARRKFEKNLKQGQDYNQHVQRDHFKKIKKDIEDVQIEDKKQRDMKT